ncbi:MAG: three-Cys-motif partner protein TcmP, partial [Terracidiphilus sp.]
MSPQQEIQVEDDGLVCPEVGNWAKSKYRLIALYDELFSKGMKYKWDQRVYIDLYAGAGFSKIRNTRIVLKGSPLLALGVSCPFDKYIFCEGESDKLRALEARVARAAQQAVCTFVQGNCDSKVDEILASVPHSSRENRVLSLCVVDPFDFGLKFATLKQLSSLKVDFLVLLAVAMDANRAYEHYVEGKNPKLDMALGNVNWRKRWSAQPRGRDEFLNFLAEEFAQSMVSLGYRKTGPA